ncbi:MAG: hypothetical protein JWQ20_1652 [Conexibacter sp.]|nr:hypothetical protein [Solirubrobacterales bacterium]MCW3002354.1 hypothetical protein [Conexibacter sp.]
MSPDDLDRSLKELATATSWPATPDVATHVRAQIDAGSPLQAPPQRVRHGRAVVAALAVAAAAVSPVGATVARLIGVAGGERVERITTTPGGRGAPGAAPRLRRLDLGRRVPLATAGRIAGFRVRRPRPTNGANVEARVGGALGPRSVSLLLADDAILTQTPGSATLGATKLIGPSTPVARVTINGAPGLWIARGSRVVRILDRRRRVVDWRTALPSSGVLLWDRAGIALRLETTRSLTEALSIARTVR